MNQLKERSFALLNAWTTCDTSLIADYLDPSFTEIDRPQPTVQGLAGFNDKLLAFHQAHGEVTLKIISQIASENIVCTAWAITSALRAADSLGDGSPKLISQAGVSWTYFSNGKIVKNRIYRDILGFMLQAGYRPSYPKSAAPNPQETTA